MLTVYSGPGATAEHGVLLAMEYAQGGEPSLLRKAILSLVEKAASGEETRIVIFSMIPLLVLRLEVALGRFPCSQLKLVHVAADGSQSVSEMDERGCSPDFGLEVEQLEMNLSSQWVGLPHSGRKGCSLFTEISAAAAVPMISGLFRDAATAFSPTVDSVDALSPKSCPVVVRVTLQRHHRHRDVIECIASINGWEWRADSRNTHPGDVFERAKAELYEVIKNDS